jgi:hypothetical protein
MKLQCNKILFDTNKSNLLLKNIYRTILDKVIKKAMSKLVEIFEFVESIGAKLRSFSELALTPCGIKKNLIVWLNEDRPPSSLF